MNDEILNKLHKIAMAFEDNGNEYLANELHNVFIKLSAKKKRNKPNKCSFRLVCLSSGEILRDYPYILVQLPF